MRLRRKQVDRIGELIPLSRLFDLLNLSNVEAQDIVFFCDIVDKFSAFLINNQ